MYSVFLIILLLNFQVWSQHINKAEVRSLYLQSVNNEKTAKTFYEKLQNENLKKDYILLAYSGVSSCLLAKYAFLPTTKLKHFQEGTKILESAVAYSPNSVEIRFLRISIQVNSPSILGYKSKIEEDKNFILKSLSELKKADKDLNTMIVDFFITNKLCSEKDISKNLE